MKYNETLSVAIKNAETEVKRLEEEVNQLNNNTKYSELINNKKLLKTNYGKVSDLLKELINIGVDVAKQHKEIYSETILSIKKVNKDLKMLQENQISKNRRKRHLDFDLNLAKNHYQDLLDKMKQAKNNRHVPSEKFNLNKYLDNEQIKLDNSRDAFGDFPNPPTIYDEGGGYSE